MHSRAARALLVLRSGLSGPPLAGGPLWYQGDRHAGEIIPVIDPVSLAQNQVRSMVDGDRPVLRMPMVLVFLGGCLPEPVPAALGRPRPSLVARGPVPAPVGAGMPLQSEKAESLLSWRPRVGVYEGIHRELASPRAGWPPEGYVGMDPTP